MLASLILLQLIGQVPSVELSASTEQSILRMSPRDDANAAFRHTTTFGFIGCSFHSPETPSPRRRSIIYARSAPQPRLRIESPVVRALAGLQWG